MGQIVFIIAAIVIIAIGKALNKRMGQALTEDNDVPPPVPDLQSRQQWGDYEPELEDMNPEMMVTELTDYQPPKYQFTYEQLENLTSEIEQYSTKTVLAPIAAQSSVQSSTRVHKKFPLREAMIYSEIMKPKFNEYN